MVFKCFQWCVLKTFVGLVGLVFDELRVLFGFEGGIFWSSPMIWLIRGVFGGP